MKNKLKKLPQIFDAAIICAAIMLAVYAVKGVWPFGDGNIFYDDMAQGAVPALYHIYDWIHGDKALNWDWYTGLGTNVTNFGNPTPLMLFLCLFKREDVYLAVNLFVVLKIAAAALTSKYCLRKMFPEVDGIWHTLFAVTYSMSTFSMVYYTNTSWLDFIVILPLIIYGLKRLLEENKPFMYIIFLAVSLFYSVYQGFMIILSVFLMSALYLILLAPREKRCQSAVTLGISTLSGGLISCFSALPAALQLMSSKRFETGVAGKENLYLKVLKTAADSQIHNKLILLIGLQLVFALTIVLAVRLFRDKKNRKFLFAVGSVLMMLSPIFIESINLLWHFGSYVLFPSRFFFIFVFILQCLALGALREYPRLCPEVKSKVLKVLMALAGIMLIVVFVFGCNYFAQFFLDKDADNSKTLYKINSVIYLFTGGLPLFLLVLFQKKYIMKALSFVLCIIQVFSVCYAGVANSHEQEDEEYLYNSPSYLEFCSEVSALDTDCGEFGRIKNYDTSLNTNYPLIIGEAALSNWTHSIPLYTQKAAANLGYGTQYTRVLDSGGTAFTDGMFGVTKLIMRNHQQATAQYKLLESTENFSLYENAYAVDFGLLAGEEILRDITKGSVNNRFTLQNSLWDMFTGTGEELFDICTRDENGRNITLIGQEPGKLTFYYTPQDNEILYMNAGEYKKQTYKISVNGEKVLASYHKYTDYRYYPSAAVNGLLTLGSFNAGEHVEIVVECINGQEFGSKPVQLGAMSLTRLNTLNNLYADTVTDEKIENTSLSFNYHDVSGENRYVFIPVNYDSGFSCRINGEKAEVHQALGAYVAVELPEGSGTVKLSWSPEGQGAGIALTVLGILLAAGLFIMLRRDTRFPKILSKVTFVILVIAFAVAVIAIYVIPACYTVYNGLTPMT